MIAEEGTTAFVAVDLLTNFTLHSVSLTDKNENSPFTSFAVSVTIKSCAAAVAELRARAFNDCVSAYTLPSVTDTISDPKPANKAKTIIPHMMRLTLPILFIIIPSLMGTIECRRMIIDKHSNRKTAKLQTSSFTPLLQSYTLL